MKTIKENRIEDMKNNKDWKEEQEKWKQDVLQM